MKLDLETLISIAILIAFGVMIFKGGTKNPVGTGALQKQLNTIGAIVRRMEETMGGLASKDEVTVLRNEMEELERRTASSGEIVGLQGEVKVLHTKIDAVKDAADRTDAGVQRIEGLFLSRGINK